MLKVGNKTVRRLVEKYHDIHVLGEISALLSWDQNVGMPSAAAGGRAAQLTYLQNQITDLWHAGEFDLQIKSLDTKTLGDVERAIIRNLERAVKYYTRVPKTLIAQKTEVNAQAFSVWQEARQKNDYKMYQGILKKVFELEKQVAQHLADTKNPYDSLLDLYEPDLTSDTVKKLFGELKPAIKSLLSTIVSTPKYKKDNAFLTQDMSFPLDAQKKLSDFMLHAMQFPSTRGRLDQSAHPFTTTVGAHDVRITTRYLAHDFRSSYASTIHEAGHALYELGINEDYAGTPLGGGVSLGIHESQSRYWENMVGKNPLFLAYMEPVLQALFPAQFASGTIQDFIRYVNYVRPGHIRVEADEVTYNLHIILRFEIEHDLINNKLQFEDLQDAWNTKTKQYLGITPPNDTNGVLQDVHWSYGSIGYFPTYTLGNIYAAQIAAKMNKEIKIKDLLAHGELAPIREWLKKNVHQYGSFYMPKELIKKLGYAGPDSSYFISYLTKKYAEIF